MTTISRCASAFAGAQDAPQTEGDAAAAPLEDATEPLAASTEGVVGGLLDSLREPFHQYSPEYRNEQAAQAAVAPKVAPAMETVAQLSRPVDTAALNVLANAFTANEKRWTQPRDAQLDAASRLDVSAGEARMTADFEAAAAIHADRPQHKDQP